LGDALETSYFVGFDKDLFRTVFEIEKAKSKRAVFFSTNRFLDVRTVAVATKKALPGVEVILSGPDSEFSLAIEVLKKGQVDLVIRANNVEELNRELLLSAQNQRHLMGPRTYWKDSGVIQWNRKKDARKEFGESTLFVLMPAWNNDYAPLGLSYLSAYAKEAGHSCETLDLNWLFWHRLKEKNIDPVEFRNILIWTDESKFTSKTRQHLDEIFEELREKIATGNYSHVGFSLFMSNLRASEEAFAIVRELKPEIKIFCGGPSCTETIAKKYLVNKNIDAAVFGEGEVSTIKLLEKWAEGSAGEVAGTWLQNGDGNILKGNTRSLTDFNSLPLPDFSGFNVYDYDYTMLPITFSRGCVAKCAFCAETKYWTRFRILKPERVLEMVKQNIFNYGIERYRVNDSLINGSPRHLEKFADLILENKLKVEFGGYCRLEETLTREFLAKLSRAGCKNLSFGMETASQKVTNLMRKETDVKNYAQIIRDTHAAGIKVWCCIIVGFPGEGWRDYFQTVKMIFKLRNSIDFLNLNVLNPQYMVNIGEDMSKFGVAEGSMAIDSWKTVDGKNTPTVRLIRYWILAKLWEWGKRKGAAVESWLHAARKTSSKGKVFVEA
jgi:anaerobic magnesium-protoporphyrin IX monomethyl ester cyclase